MGHRFLDFDDLGPGDVEEVLDLAVRSDLPHVLAGMGVAMVFEKPSARTRSSTEMAAVSLGGHPVYIQGPEVGIDVREPAEDVARTLACYHRLICARVNNHAVLERMADALERANSDVAMVNLLSDRAHPCQAVADLVTLRDSFGRGELKGMKLAYIGDANNVCRSLVKAGLAVGMEIRLACPRGYDFEIGELDALTAWGIASGRGGTLHEGHDPRRAVEGVDAIYTDVWTSMGQEAEADQRRADFEGFTVEEELVDLASPDAIVLHCLPAHRGEEITAGVVDGPQSRVWLQAAHRRSAMRGIFAWLMGVRTKSLDDPGGR